ncbi:MAG: YbaN family protein [Parasphingorhabdus sp.]
MQLREANNSKRSYVKSQYPQAKETYNVNVDGAAFRAGAITKIFYRALGLLLVGIGFVGMVLPVLPGIPFFVAAIFCFERSSLRLKRWLLNHRWIGPGLSAWHERHSISMKLKVSVLLMMASAIPVIIFQPITGWIKFLLISALIASAVFILTRPST